MKVHFRKFKSDNSVIALFPEIAANSTPWLHCMSYTQVGQHGAASHDLKHCTVAATEEEYTPLLRKLVLIGYDDLKIVKRITQQMIQKCINSNGV